jgi:hypothetical protein
MVGFDSLLLAMAGVSSLRILCFADELRIAQGLTPWSRVLEKLTITQLVKKFFTCYGT